MEKQKQKYLGMKYENLKENGVSSIAKYILLVMTT
jgi:hypothetical protein